MFRQGAMEHACKLVPPLRALAFLVVVEDLEREPVGVRIEHLEKSLCFGAAGCDQNCMRLLRREVSDRIVAIAAVAESPLLDGGDHEWDATGFGGHVWPSVRAPNIVLGTPSVRALATTLRVVP